MLGRSYHSALSMGLKNSVLVALIIVVAHFLIKTKLTEQQPRSSSTALSEHYAEDAPPAPAATIASTPAPAPASISPAQQEPKVGSPDLLAYVFGSGSGAAAAEDQDQPPSLAAPPAAQAPPPQCGEKKPRVMQPLASSAPSGDGCGRMIVAAYRNEKPMCGGALYDGKSELTGYDGSDSLFAPL